MPGSKSDLLRTLAAISGAKSAIGGVRSSVLDWRKGWDSNPRYPCRYAGFQDRCLKPLGHPSKPLISLTETNSEERAKSLLLLKLLLNFFGRQRDAPYSRAERQVEPRRRVLLQRANDVRVQIKRDRNRRVSEALLDHLG